MVVVGRWSLFGGGRYLRFDCGSYLEKTMERHHAHVAVFLVALAAIILTADADDGCPEACWEKCFRVSFFVKQVFHPEFYENIYQCLDFKSLKNLAFRAN